MAKSSGGVYAVPWIHHTSHQLGGVDPVSLAGLAGTPAALTTHAADMAAHAAVIAAHAALLSGVHGLKGEVAFYAVKYVDQLVATGLGAPTQVIFPNTVWDNGLGYNGMTSRFQPTVRGKYLIALSLEVSGWAAGNEWIAHYWVPWGGGGVSGGFFWDYFVGGAKETHIGVQLREFNGTSDWCEVYMEHNRGADVNVESSSSTWWAGFLIPQSTYP